MSKEAIGVAICILFILSLQSVSAEVFTGQLESLYNLGDNLITNITLFSSSAKTSFLSINIICDTGKVEIYKNPLNIKAGEQKKIPFSTHLDSSILGNVTGTCSLQADYGNEKGESGIFEITKELITTLKLDKAVYLPGSQVQVSGTSTRKNGSPLKGFIDLSITGLSTSVSSQVNKGAFNLTLNIPDLTPSRNYIVQARVYEKDDSDLLMNEGTSQSIIKISQVAKNIDVALNSPILQPGKNLVYMVLLTDQANEDVRQDASISIIHPSGKILEKKLVKAGETLSYTLANNATPGLWKIEAKTQTLQAERTWNTEEVVNVSFSLENNTLILTNTGNTEFKKAVEVSLNGINEIKNIELGLGEKKVYKLIAPDGTYSIKVSEGIEQKDLGSSFLTGKSIEIRDINELVKGKGWNILYFILFFGLIFMAVAAYKVAVKRNYTGKMPLMSSKWDQPRLKPIMSQSSEPISFPKNSSFQHPEVKKSLGYSSATGRKEECAIMALTIHNIHELIEDDQASDLISKVAYHASSAKATVREDRNTHLMIFSPQKTKNENPSLLAVKIGRDIEKLLLEYNQKHALKINFGIGIHLGEMIVESMQGAQAYHAVGNTVIAAKRAAEKSKHQLLLTGPVHRKVSGVVKTQQIAAESLWTVTNIVEREDYSDFINKFMNRQDKDRRF